MKLGLPSWLRRGANAPAAPDAATPPPSPLPGEAPQPRRARRWPWITAVAGLVIALAWGVSFYWSREPAVLWVVAETPTGERTVVGYSTVHTLIDVTESLLDKPGGYFRNDLLPPGLWLDNMPSWEFGVARPGARSRARAAQRSTAARSRSRSRTTTSRGRAAAQLRQRLLATAVPKREYRERDRSTSELRDAPHDADAGNAQFYARADNLREWLVVVEKRSAASRNASRPASVRRASTSTSPASAPAEQPTPGVERRGHREDAVARDRRRVLRARGTAWALHCISARRASSTSSDVLEDKNAS